MEKVRVEIDVPGSGSMALEYEHCLIREHKLGSDTCPLNGCDCRFGLTEAQVPSVCPIRIGTVKMKFTRIKGKK